MSNKQRVIVRLGIEADVPALHLGELGMDTDTFTMRLGNDSSNPLKIMTTKSTGVFDFSSTTSVKFKQIEFAPGGGVAGINFESMKANTGIVVSIGNGQFREVKIGSSDNSVVVANGDGVDGDIDLTISTDSILNAVSDIRNSITQLGDAIDDITENYNNNNDTLLKLVQLSGEPAKKTDLGQFLGTIIPDGSTIRTALQALETAIGSLDAGNFHLEITGRTNNVLGLQLTPDNIVVLEGATPEFAGLMTSSDKNKLDGIDLNDVINQGITEVEQTAMDVVLHQTSNAGSMHIPIATIALAGLMSPLNKATLDNITANSPHDLDEIDTRVGILETTLSTSFFVETTDDPLFTSNINDPNAPHTVALIDTSAVIAFGIYFNRETDGVNSEFYDEIVVQDTFLVVPAENVTKSYTGAVTVYKARDGKWYYLNRQGYGVLIAAADATAIKVSCGTTNQMTIRRLAIV